jgi:hypothetical protein
VGAIGRRRSGMLPGAKHPGSRGNPASTQSSVIRGSISRRRLSALDAAPEMWQGRDSLSEDHKSRSKISSPRTASPYLARFRWRGLPYFTVVLTMNDTSLSISLMLNGPLLKNVPRVSKGPSRMTVFGSAGNGTSEVC